MTAPMLNAELAYAALDHIEANPDEYDRLVGIAKGHGLVVADFAGRVCLLAGDRPYFEQGAAEAGWVITDTGRDVLVSFRAKLLLGLDMYDETVTLPGGDLAELRADVAEIFGPRPEPVDCLCPGEFPHPERGMQPGAAAAAHSDGLPAWGQPDDDVPPTIGSAS